MPPSPHSEHGQSRYNSAWVTGSKRGCCFFYMKTELCGRIVFGASAVLFGVIALMWYDSDTSQTLRQIWSLPFGTIIGRCLMIVQIAGGIGMQYRRTARLASILLGVVYLLFSLACIPDIMAAPTVYVHYGSFFEQFPRSAERLPCTLPRGRVHHGR
jgi:hypothetical protein